MLLKLGSNNANDCHDGETEPEDVCKADARRDPSIVQEAEGRDKEEVVGEEKKSQGAREVEVGLENVVEDRIELQNHACKKPVESVFLQVLSQRKLVVKSFRPVELHLTHDETEDCEHQDYYNEQCWQQVFKQRNRFEDWWIVFFFRCIHKYWQYLGWLRKIDWEIRNTKC